MRGSRIARWLIATPMALLALATIYPMVFTVNVAMKTRHDYILDRFSLARSVRLDNLGAAWASADMGRYCVNSLVVVSAAVALLLIIGSMSGFALSHLRFRGSRLVFLGCLGALLIPFQVIMVPLARTLADVGLVDTYPGLVIAYVAQFLPFTVFLMTSYYSGIPKEIVDAA
ncbi:MAG: carbohydrate ABC transporter permease, partial [Micromonosporaceae bacterium]|nr:carbohydrate ABC transporter permease [Micromonosporaceae bacterium]